MKAKIDLEKFVRSLMERYYEKIHIDPTTTKCWLDSVLEDQGLEYKDGEIVEIDTIDTSSPRWAEIAKECKHDALEQAKKFNKERLFEVAKQETPEEKAEAEERKDLRKRYERISNSDWFKKTHAGISIGEQPLEEDVVGMGGLGKVWNEEAIISRLDRIIELLERPIIMPFSQPIQPLQPIYYDPNKDKVYCSTASTEGGEE